MAWKLQIIKIWKANKLINEIKKKSLTGQWKMKFWLIEHGVNNIPLCITSSLQKGLFSLRLNSENTDDLPLLRVSIGDPSELTIKNW